MRKWLMYGQQADRENRVTYLESSAAVNLKFYRALGFVEESEIVLKRGRKPVKLGVMVREPKTGAEGSKGVEQKILVKMVL